MILGTLSFVSMRPGTSPHAWITAEAARRAGYPEQGVFALQEAVRAPDLEQMEWDPTKRKITAVGLHGVYEPAQHADRVPGIPDGDAFVATASFVRTQVGMARRHMVGGATADAVRALGRALHAAQDVFSHSNAVELGTRAVEDVKRAVMDGEEPPRRLRLTVVDPAAPEPGRPGTSYGHDACCKDEPSTPASREVVGNDGQTAFEAASEAAVDLSAEILADWLQDIDGAGRDGVGRLAALRTSSVHRVVNRWVGLALGVAGATGLSLWWWRRARVR